MIRFAGRYTGLAGRELFSCSKPALRVALDARHRGRSHSVDLPTLTTADAIDEQLERVVGALLRPLYERFDGFALVAGQIADLRRQIAECA